MLFVRPQAETEKGSWRTGSLFMKRLLILLVCLLTLWGAAGAERLSDKDLLTYFDDCVFIGDSMMQSLRRYRSVVREKDPSFLENSTIIGTANLSLFQASRRSMVGGGKIKYRGVNHTIYEIAQMLHPRRMFISLGLNDPIGKDIDKALERMEYILVNMPDFAPEMELCIFSSTPVTEKFASHYAIRDYMGRIDEYNRRLSDLCERYGASYVEVSEPLKGEDGMLYLPYSSDKSYHLNDDGMAVLVQALLDYVQALYDADLWVPEIRIGG